MKKTKKQTPKATSTDTAKGNKKLPAIKTFLNVWLALLVGLAGCMLYANTFRHGFVLDDYSVIIENRITRQGTAAIPEIFSTPYRSGYYLVSDELYRPVPKAIFAFFWQHFPENPTPGHSLNIFLFGLTGFVLYFFLFRIFKNRFAAFAASLLFMAHPIHTEVVANIKSVDEILSFLLCITAGVALLVYLDTAKKRFIACSALSYFIALLSKESSITFLVVFPLLAYFFKNGDEKQQAPVINRLLPIFVLGITALIFLVIRYNILVKVPHGDPSIADNLLMAAKNASDKFATAIFILGMYLKLLFFPHPLVFDYSYNQIPIVGIGNWGFIASLLIHLTLLVIAIVQFKRKTILSFFLLFYFISMSIYANIFIIIGSSFGERFLYTPSLSFVALAGFFISKLNMKQNQFTLFQFLNENKMGLGVVILITAAYGYKTVDRNQVWKNNYTLYSNDVKLSPNSTRTHYYLGNLLSKPEMTEGKDSLYIDSVRNVALSELEKSVAIYPKFGDAYNQMGMTWDRKKNFQKAMESYQKALATNEKNPIVFNNYATLFFNVGKYDEAFENFRMAIKLKPDYAEAYMNMGSTYGMQKKYDDALNCFFNAIKFDPSLAQAYYFAGITYRFKGDEVNAQAYLSKAHKLNPAKY